jgi:hypothetical protein
LDDSDTKIFPTSCDETHASAEVAHITEATAAVTAAVTAAGERTPPIFLLVLEPPASNVWMNDNTRTGALVVSIA